MSQLQTLLNVELPIIQAPMAGAHASEMTIAVCKAGGLGSLPCAMMDHATIERELTTIRDQIGTRAYNVNFFCHTAPQPDAQREAAWRQTLMPFFKELDLDPSGIEPGPGRMPFDQAAVDVLKAFRPPVVSFHFGLPDATLLKQVKSWGTKILASATTVQEGLWLQSHGADAVIAQGLEAGGHRGIFLSDDISTQVGLFALLPQLVSALEIPVIAAGGVAHADGVRACLSLGAVAAQIGTSYLLCNESNISALHRQALQSQAAQHTALTNLFTGRPARGIMNRYMRELGPLRDDAPQFPLATTTAFALRTAAEKQGSSDFSPLWAGQNTEGCDSIDAGTLTRRLAGLA
jgi:nitronate monooxygenase